jgi:hypothetical protein
LLQTAAFGILSELPTDQKDFSQLYPHALFMQVHDYFYSIAGPERRIITQNITANINRVSVDAAADGLLVSVASVLYHAIEDFYELPKVRRQKAAVFLKNLALGFIDPENDYRV